MTGEERESGPGQHPALGTDSGPGRPSALTLVLPPGLGSDEVVRELIRAIGEARTTLEQRASLFQQRVEEYAASGQPFSQALCRGQYLASWCAIAVIDEAITEAFGLWPHYEDAISETADIPTGAATSRQPPGPGGPGAQVFPFHDHDFHDHDADR